MSYDVVESVSRPLQSGRALALVRNAWSTFRSWLAQSTSRTMQWTSALVAAMLQCEGGTSSRPPMHMTEHHAQVVMMTA